ncbi:tobamovirus multiplication protein 2A-like [Panicum miliaceum]|uniref:Tobamovirus multiplication protein 2A-like n=1 Tax=Panicum miliaceum TaxID=4540 RepID=A0A3L6PQA9_PANMI|nr:tobamovirus multiplication protein 2A-like [Panicum miliaceum]
MACRGFFECVLKLLNLVVMAVGLAMVGYGAYLLAMWLQVVPPPAPPMPPSPAPVAVAASGGLVRLGRPPLLLVDASALSDGTAERLSSAWFIFAFIGVGVVVPVDKTGNFDMMYSFLKENWRIAKWVALGAVIFEALLFTVAIIVQSGNQADYDSDDEYIGPRSGIRQPLVNQHQQAAADPRVPNLDYRPIRNDAWSQRMREKYGVDSFDPNRFQQATISPVEQRNQCTIL